MNVRLNTININPQYKANQNRNNNLSFGAKIDIPTKSGFLDPFKRGMDKATDFIAKNYTSKLYQSKLAEFLAKRMDKLNGVVDHMQFLGSLVVTGTYMTETLKKKNLDEDGKKTLAFNQFSTLAISTLGSYLIDGMLNKKWENLTARYAEKNLGVEDKFITKQLEKSNTELLAQFKADKLQGIIPSNKKFKPMTVLDYISKNHPNTGLEGRIRGMGVLKKLLVFGTIYRFLAPVAVTPFANWIGNNYINKKHTNQDNKENIAKIQNQK